MSDNKVLEVKNLKTHFLNERGKLTAINDISFDINTGEIVGLVRESGSGKSVTSQSIIRLLNEDTAEYNGEINYDNRNLLKISEKKMREIRGNDISMIFQDPSTSLNPVLTLGKQLTETIMQHEKTTKKQAFIKGMELLKSTGIPCFTVSMSIV